ncbi:MAG: glycosyltransferase family A protein [Solirubrobacterales bacterium]
MNAAPRHSVIVPAYNGQRTIRTTIQSVLAQTVSDLELIVIDDGSVDATPDIVAEYTAAETRVQLIRQPNGGTAAARNRGLAAARGTFVSILDNDDAWLPWHLERTAAALEVRPNVGLGYADAWIFNDATGRVNRRTSLSFYPDRAAPDADVESFLAALLVKNFIIASSTTMTRTALDLVGGFEAALRGTDDWDMWLRIAMAGMNACQVDPEPTTILRFSATSQSSDLAMMVRGNTEVLERVVARLPDGSGAGALARERLAINAEWLRSLEDPTPGEAIEAALRRTLGPVKRAALAHRDLVDPPAAVRAVMQVDVAGI